MRCVTVTCEAVSVSGTETSGSAVGRSADRRKLIALVHMDVDASSRLMGLDDVGTLERLQALRRELIDPAIAEHGGRLVNTGGDTRLTPRPRASHRRTALSHR